MTPEVADAARDVIALVRTQLNNDRDGALAIVNSLDHTQARVLLIMSASLTAHIMKAQGAPGGDAATFLANFSQEYLS